MFSHLFMAALLSSQTTDDFDTLVLKNNETLHARVLSLEGEKVRLQVALAGGSAEVRKDLADFTPASVFRIVSAASPPQTVDDHLRMASLAADNDLPGAATRELETARKVADDQALGQDVDARIHERNVAVMERTFRQRLLANDPDGARRQLEELVTRYPDSEPAGRRHVLMAEVVQLETRLEAERANAAALVAAQKRQVVLDAVRREMNAGDAANRRGLLSGKAFAEARRQFLVAAGHYEAGLRSAEKLAVEEPQTEPGTTGSFATRSLVQQARSNAAEALLNAASLDLIQGQHREALAKVHRALAIDPQSQNARGLRARIELAANDSSWMGGNRVVR